MRFLYLILVIAVATLTFSASQPTKDDLNAVSSGLIKFSLELLSETSNIGGKNLNLVLSPFSVWSVLVLLLEGSSGNTYKQIHKALHLPHQSVAIRRGYFTIEKLLQEQQKGVQLVSANGIFTDINRPIQYEFENVAEKQYRANVYPIDFRNPMQSTKNINKWFANITNNRITEVINPGDLTDHELLVANAVYFKGLWSSPFNASKTHTDEFYDEDENVIGKVNMMVQKGNFLFGFLENLGAQVVELPYQGNKFCMLLFLPEPGVKLSTVLQNLREVSISEIFNTLKNEKEQYMEEELIVFLPRFSVQSDLILNVVLHKLGIKDIFDPRTAQMSQISPHKIFLSRLIHKTEIEVTEEGTVASAATGALFGFKSMASRFYANHPFAYFIVERTLNTIVFAGTVSNPNNLQ